MKYLKYWPIAAAALLAIAIVLAWRSALNARELAGKAKERIRVADSVIAANKATLTRTDTAILHDTKTVVAYVDRYHADTLWRHDTVRVAGDTSVRIAIPTATLALTDSTIRACRQLADDCAAFRLSANATMAAQQSKIDALSSQINAGRHIWDRCGISVGAGAVYSAGRIDAGPGILASCKVWP